MANFLDKYLANGLRDFAGLQVRGSVPVKQEILNEILAEVLKQGQSDAAATEATPAAAAPPANLDPKALLRHVKNAQVRAEDGRLDLDFEVRIDG